MSKSNKIFNSIPLSVPDRSGFDLSHEVLTSALCGSVVPVSWCEVLPGDTLSCGSRMKVTLPPFAVPFMGRIDAELTAAFIPYRLLWSGWKNFIMQNTGISPSASSSSNIITNVPCVYLDLSEQESSDYLKPYTLANYLGIKANSSGEQVDFAVSALPFLAYHKFCDDWIRVDEVMKPFFPDAFVVSSSSSSSSSIDIPRTLSTQGRLLPFVNSTYSSVDPHYLSLLPFTQNQKSAIESSSFKDYLDTSLTLNSVRQRCWSKDYFTSATLQPQAGATSSVAFDTSGNTGSFSIATLRAANSLQKWRERNNIASPQYDLLQLAHWGVTPPDAALQRSVLLGSVREPVYVGSVDNTTTGTANSTGYSQDSSNPFGNILGSAAGIGSSTGEGSLIDNFEAKEYGIVMFFFSLIPHAYYSTGVPRQFLHTTFGDFAWPEFANIGDQPISNLELNGLSDDLTFGYQQRYAEYKFMSDFVTGKLGAVNSSSGLDNSLEVYALQRSFIGERAPVLGSQFLEIPTDFLDQVFSVTTSASQFSCLLDAYFDFRALRVLPEYSLPSL